MTNVDFDNNLMDNKTEQIVANETAPSQENTVEYPGATSSLKEPLPQTLQPTPLRRRQTGPTASFDGLTAAQAVLVGDRVMHFLRELCRRRGAAVDFEYWRKITKRVLNGLTGQKPLVCPARAGSGKSAWITAFLLAACELVPTKNSRSRTLVASPTVVARLRHRKVKQTQQRLMAGCAWEDSNLVFTDALGHHLTKPTVYRHYKKAVAAIGRPDARYHDLRHSYAVAAISSGIDIKTVQGNLGHATAAFTLDVYGHVTDRMKRESADKMEDFIRRVSGD